MVTLTDLDPDDPTCCICQEDFKVGEQLRVLPCGAGHRFHVSCIDRWLKLKGECPVCRVDIRSKGSKDKGK